ncbi:MAG: DUF262 domain-containing protein [Chloroflexota bacterium]|nr:DUF262 domain-containing protein [Chloroflexota bacterium]MDQ5866967.1 DUF262 domain-containing protein [Chloroflexota bacterium]
MSDTRTVFKHVDYELSGLLHYIDIGDIGLPDIQRPFVWPATKVRDLFDSMYRGFPVGYLLFWQNAGIKGARAIGVGPKTHSVPTLLIVDGQQRLTSLYAVLRGKPVIDHNYRETRIEIAFRPRDAKFEVADAAIRKDPEFIADISTVWSSGKGSYNLIKKFLVGLASRREVSEEEHDTISENLDRLYDLQKYPFTALEVAASVDEEAVADIFVRINSEGVKLNQADFILTLMSVFWEQGRVQLEQFSRAAKNPPQGSSATSPYNPYIKPAPDQLLRVGVGLGFHRARLQHVYSLLRGKDLDTGIVAAERREAQFAILQRAQDRVLNLQNWAEFFKSLLRAGYRSGDMITSETALLYSYTLFLVGKHEYGVDHFTLRDVIARWFFMTSLTARYSASPETMMEQDLARLREVKSKSDFVSLLERIISDTLTEDYWKITLPNNLATSSARTPSLFAYYAALILLDARALFSKVKIGDLLNPAMQAQKSAVERHHLFPKAYLTREGISGTMNTNQIANFALMEWFDNISVSDTPPAVYYPQFASRFSTEELERMRYWHALPQGWEHMDYFDFLAIRRRLIAGVIQDGFTHLYD